MSGLCFSRQSFAMLRQGHVSLSWKRSRALLGHPRWWWWWWCGVRSASRAVRRPWNSGKLDSWI